MRCYSRKEWVSEEDLPDTPDAVLWPYMRDVIYHTLLISNRQPLKAKLDIEIVHSFGDQFTFEINGRDEGLAKKLLVQRIPINEQQKNDEYDHYQYEAVKSTAFELFLKDYHTIFEGERGS